MRIGPRRRTSILARLRYPRDPTERSVFEGKLHMLGITAQWCKELSREYPRDEEAWWDGLESHALRYRKRIGPTQALPAPRRINHPLQPTPIQLRKRGERMILERIERSIQVHRYAQYPDSPLRRRLQFLREFVSAKRRADALKLA